MNPKETLKKIFKNLNFDSFIGPKWAKNVGLWSPPLTHLQKYLRWACKAKPTENFQQNRWKPMYWPILVLFGAKRAQNLAHWGHFFTHTWKYQQYACKPNSMVLYQKLFEKMAKNSPNSHFYLFFVIKDQSKKLKQENQNSTPSTFRQYGYAHSHQISGDRMKTEGAYCISKKVVRQAARHRISSADCQQRAKNWDNALLNPSSTPPTLISLTHLPWTKGHHFADNIFWYIFVNKKFFILIKNFSENWVQFTINQQWFR